MDAGGRRTDTPGEAALIEAGPRDGGCRRERGDNNTFIIFLPLLFLLPSFTSLYLRKNYFFIYFIFYIYFWWPGSRNGPGFDTRWVQSELTRFSHGIFSGGRAHLCMQYCI